VISLRPVGYRGRVKPDLYPTLWRSGNALIDPTDVRSVAE